MNTSNHHCFLDNQQLKDIGALQTGHFLLTSGRHSDTYVEKFRILEDPKMTSQAAKLLAAVMFYNGVKADLVVGPTTGGVIVAHVLADKCDTKAVYVERENGELKLRRGSKINPGSKVVITDDVLTTGRSVLEVAKIVEDSGAKVVACCVLVDRREEQEDLGFPCFAAYRVEAKSYAPDALPELLQGTPTTKPGTR